MAKSIRRAALTMRYDQLNEKLKAFEKKIGADKPTEKIALVQVKALKKQLEVVGRQLTRMNWTFQGSVHFQPKGKGEGESKMTRES